MHLRSTSPVFDSRDHYIIVHSPLPVSRETRLQKSYRNQIGALQSLLQLWCPIIIIYNIKLIMIAAVLFI